MTSNKITNYLSVGLVTLICLNSLTSCEKDVVDLKPVNSLTEITAYSTPERVELAVIGAYDAAQCGVYNGSYQRGYPFGAASIIQNEMRGQDMNLTAVFYGITYNATYNTTTANNKFMWETSFEAINRYNTVLKGVNDALTKNVIPADKANQYKGELLFLRALTYHNLMIHFALPYNVSGNNNYGLPLYLSSVNTPDEIKSALLIGRSSVNDTYSQILKDLDEAESLLPEENDVNIITRASKAAPIALKSRVYLHERNWAKVVEESRKLTNNATIAPFVSSIGDYQLEADPTTPFVSFSDNKESIFSIENNTSDNADVNGAMSAMMSARTGGRAIITSSPILYNSKFWLANDKRRDLLLYRSSDKYYFCDKYQDPTTRKEYAPIIRYAEVLLNYAEAEVRTSTPNTTLALELLNSVRNRSLADPTTEAYKNSDFATTNDLLEAILWERRIEFHGEGRRWEDIHRLAADDIFPSGGIPAKIDYANTKNKGVFVVNGAIDPTWYSSSAKAIPYTDKRFLWPIPIDDIIRNPTLAGQQNKDW